MFQTDGGDQSDTGKPTANDVLFAFRWFERVKDSHSLPPVTATVAAAELLVESSVRPPGIDEPSVDYDGAAHVKLLGTNSVAGENLVNLSRLPELFEVSVLPHPFAGGDGSPVRAITRVQTR
jgi:kynurenine formamidase